jgi:anthranilate synthase component 2
VILVIDNYDSFTYNLMRYLHLLGHETEVIRNDAVPIAALQIEQYSHVLISPGPGHPKASNLSLEVIHHFGSIIPIFGVCLGLQCFVQSFGGEVARTQPQHGKSSLVYHHAQGVMRGLPNPITVGRYHSLAATLPLPHELEVTAWTQDENGNVATVMGVKHRQLPLEAVQFHPESVLTEKGMTLLANFFGRFTSGFFNL